MTKPTLTAEQQRNALTHIAAWRATGATPACPACGKPGLAVVDCSARPHAEWYKLSCPSCGLDHLLTVPIAARGNSF